MDVYTRQLHKKASLNSIYLKGLCNISALTLEKIGRVNLMRSSLVGFEGFLTKTLYYKLVLVWNERYSPAACEM